jgi:PKD repeat protein
MSFTNRCVNKTVSFQDQSTISCDSIIRHRWTFGDGSTASKANPDHTYTQPGQYRIKLVITLGNGAQDSTTRSIDIHPEPVAAFRTQNICKGDTAAFSSQSRISKGAITNYQWDFGDSSQGSGISPDHYYQQFGTYQTQLTVTSDSGCVDSTTQKLVVNPTPQPAFSSTRPCFGDTTRFSDSSTIGKGAITQYQWQFGDGDSSLLQNPAHFYQQPGVYNTNLTVTSDSGCRASKTKQARVDSLPRVSFSIDSLICKNQSYNLTNNSTIADSFQWQFGDGRTFSSKTPNHTYQDTGSYEVKLVAFNNYGCADSFSRQVRVIQKPDVSFSTNKDSFCGPTANVVFSNFSTGYQPSYQWDLGNGQQRNQQFIDTIDYAQNNDTDTTYYITLTATNQCGVVQQRDSINVFPAPISRFTMSQDQGCSPVKVQFKDSATGLPDTYLWQFASDDTSQRPEPRHAFRTGTSDTTYGIRQITTNRCGRDTAIDSVTVFPNTIDAIFQVDTTLGCQPLTVDFQNLSSAGATRFSWQFGDGDISNKASPNHTYTSADTFSVSMVATNGCSYDTFRNTIRTFPKPDVQGQVSKPEACAKEDFELRNQTSDVSSVLWLYNNESDTLSTQPNATVSLDSAGQRIITQKVRSVAYDCPAKQQDTIRIQPLPSIAISLDTSSGCPPLRVAFSNDADNVVSRLWEFGDGKQAIAANPVHTYRNTGNYTASLEATTDKGCTDSGSTEINVFPSPDAQFSTTPDSACGPPAESKLTDQSTGATLSRWNLPEGRQSDSSTLTVRLDSVGDYPIELVSRNRFGCRDTANQSFTVYPAPRADFEALNARRACVPHAVNLSSQAVNTDKTYWSLDGSLLDSGRQTTAEVKPTVKSDVRMVAIGAGGCQDTLIKADWLEGYPRPEARFDYQPLRDPEARGKFQFEDASRGAARVRWSFGDGTGSMKPDPVHRYPGNGTYKPELVATTDKGCKDTATQTLQPDFFSGLQVPNAIKPNSSKPGVRTFKPKGVGLESYHIGIYTKWGELVWESSELQDGAPAEAWDGTYQNGELCPQGSYVWKVKAQFKDGTQWQGQETETGDYKTIGTVTLIR